MQNSSLRPRIVPAGIIGIILSYYFKIIVGYIAFNNMLLKEPISVRSREERQS